MTIQHEQRTVTKIVEETVSVTCDLCKQVYENARDVLAGIEWADTRYEIDNTCVQASEGSSYPDGGNEVHTIYHICPKCFREKLVPWLTSQGVDPIVEEVDW